MKSALIGAVVGAAATACASALAVTSGDMVLLKPGQAAYVSKDSGPVYTLGRTVCAAVSKRGQPAFNCYVTDSQNVKRFGVTINPLEVTAFEYLPVTAKSQTRILFRRSQGPAWVIRG